MSRKKPLSRKWYARLNRGLMIAMTPLQIVSNFVFLSVAYFVGVGFSSLLYRMGPGRKKTRENLEAPDASGSYWRKLAPASTDRDAWLRPF